MKLLPGLPLLSCLGLLRGEPPGLHSLHFVFSFLSEPFPGAPQYSVVGYVDGGPIISYTSESPSVEPRATWMEKITDEDPRFWEESAQTLQEVKKILNDSLRNLMEQNDQAIGLHVFQAIQGCELREDGSGRWFERYAYDGSNFSATTENRENSEELIECIKYLKKLLKYGEESLMRRVTPRTMVSRRKTGDCTFLIGYAYGFYPSEIEVKWVHDGVEMPWESRELLPHPDGTYQVRTVVEVQEGDDERTYEYHVNHSSLLETVTMTHDSPGGSLQGLRLTSVVLVTVTTVVLAVLAGTLILKWILRKRFPSSHYKRPRSREAPPSGVRNEEGLVMFPPPVNTPHHNSEPLTPKGSAQLAI